MHETTIKEISDILADKNEMVDDTLVLFVTGMVGIGKSTCIEEAIKNVKSKMDIDSIYQLKFVTKKDFVTSTVLSEINKIIQNVEKTTIIIESSMPLSQIKLPEPVGSSVNIREVTIYYPSLNDLEKWCKDREYSGDIRNMYQKTNGHPILLQKYLANEEEYDSVLDELISKQLSLISQTDNDVLYEFIEKGFWKEIPGDSVQRLNQMGLIIRKENNWNLAFPNIKKFVKSTVMIPPKEISIINYQQINKKHLNILYSLLEREYIVQCEKQTHGKSSAIVYQVNRHDPEGRYLSPLFIKIDLTEKVEKEISNGYKVLKKWIPAWLPEIKGKKSDGALTGFLMTSAGRYGISSGISTLSDIKDIKRICNILEQIFINAFPILHQTNSSGTASRCLDLSERNRNHVLAVADRLMAPHRNIEYFFDNLGKFDYPLVKGLCHGDLHPGNIIIDKTNTSWFIDFASVKDSRNLLFDYATLEINLVYFMEKELKKELIESAYTLIDKGITREDISYFIDQEEIRNTFFPIFYIREIAKNNFVNAELDAKYDFNINYEFAYLSSGLLFLMRIDNTFIERWKDHVKQLVFRLNNIAEYFCMKIENIK